jgi:hypothetical protein
VSKKSNLHLYALLALALIGLAVAIGSWAVPQATAFNHGDAHLGARRDQVENGSVAFSEEEHILFIPVLANQSCSIFLDDFSDPGSGWPVGGDNEAIFGYLAGEYQVRSKRSGFYFLFASPACSRDNFTIEVDARWEGEPGQDYGLLFDMVGNYDQFYLFGINSLNQTYTLDYYGPGSWVLLIRPQKSDAIQTGQASNHLRVSRVGEQIELAINGRVVHELDDDRVAAAGQSGLFMNPSNRQPAADARFDNFVSRYAP